MSNSSSPVNLRGLTSIIGLAGEPAVKDFLASSPLLSKITSPFIAFFHKIDFTTWTLAIAVLGTFPSALHQLRAAASGLLWWAAKHFMSSVSIGANDRLNKEVINWVGNRVLPRRAARTLNARTEVISTNVPYWRVQTTERDDVTHEKRVPIQYLPSYGTTWFIHDWNLFLIKRISANANKNSLRAMVEYSSAAEGYEPLVVMCLGRSPDPIKSLFETCRNFAD